MRPGVGGVGSVEGVGEGSRCIRSHKICWERSQLVDGVVVAERPVQQVEQSVFS